MGRIDTSLPVVVLKIEHYGSLGIMRSLGRLGIPVYGIDRSPHTPALHSRYCTGQFLWDVETASPAASVEFLRAVGRRLGRRALLIPTSDETTQFVANQAEALGEVFCFPRPPSGLVARLCSKKEMFFLAQACGIPTAQAVFPQSRADVEAWLERLTFPVMLKGIDGGRLERRTGKKMMVVRTPTELVAAYEALEEPEWPNLMVQEYIPGQEDSVWMFNGYFDADSECVTGFTGRKLRQNPVYTGMTSLGECVRNERVRELTVRFMRAVGYQGILDIEYRYDRRDREYKVLDVNPRVGATFRLFVADNGLDVVRALYLNMTGQHVYGGAVREGRKWVVEDKDLLSSYRYWRVGELGVGARVRSLWGVEEAGYWAWDDLRPFWLMCRQHVQRSFGRWVAKRASPLDKRRLPHEEFSRIVLEKHPVMRYEQGILLTEDR